MKIEIRKANEGDKSAVLALGKKMVDVYERTHLGDEIANEYINSGACENDLASIYSNASIALHENETIAFIFTKNNEIQGFAVEPLYWSKGIAQKLIAYATRELFKGYNEIQLECFASSQRANRFYQKMGFENCGIVNGDGGSRIVYKRIINGEKLSSKQVLLNWIDIFNKADAKALTDLYHIDAINHQVALDPLVGKQAIYERFVEEFATADMVCIVENIFEDNEWAIMEWKDPKGFRGCGFFHIIDGKIVFQRGYWDKLSFMKRNNLN